MRDYIRERLILRLGITRNNGNRAINASYYNSQANSELSKHSNDRQSNESNDNFSFKLLDLSQSDSSRLKYLRKLSYLKIWLPSVHRAPKHQTAIIFDWDDTLLCTSYLNSISTQNNSDSERSEGFVNSSAQGSLGENLTYAASKNKINDSELKEKNSNFERNDKNNNIFLIFSEELQNILKSIQKCVLELLEKSLQMGHVFLITNASEDWVDYSANLYLPEIVHVLSKLTVISARSKYEQKFPGAYHKWKFHAFLEIQKKLNSETITNLISIGDSIIEMEAVHILGREFSESLVKTIKMKESPTPDELYKQLTLINSKFENICLNARNLKIVLEKRVI